MSDGQRRSEPQKEVFFHRRSELFLKNTTMFGTESATVLDIQRVNFFT